MWAPETQVRTFKPDWYRNRFGFILSFAAKAPPEEVVLDITLMPAQRQRDLYLMVHLLFAYLFEHMCRNVFTCWAMFMWLSFKFQNVLMI